jgi:hypothetical protein
MQNDRTAYWALCLQPVDGKARVLFTSVAIVSYSLCNSVVAEYARLRRVATFAYANSASQSEAMRERER